MYTWVWSNSFQSDQKLNIFISYTYFSAEIWSVIDQFNRARISEVGVQK